MIESQAILGIRQLRYLAQGETRIGRKTETIHAVALFHARARLHIRSQYAMLVKHLTETGA